MKDNIHMNNDQQESVNPAQLSVLSYANHFTFWHYKTAHVSVLTPHYFDPVIDILRENDMILVTTDIDDTPKTMFYIVIARTKMHIVVSPLDITGSDDDNEGQIGCHPSCRMGASARTYNDEGASSPSLLH